MVVVHASRVAAALNYIGCFDDSSDRLLNGSYKQTPGNTVESCGVYCGGLGFKYAGLEFGNQCFCGSDLPSNATAAACDTPCAGNDRETCGGTWTLSIYEITSQLSNSSSSSSSSLTPIIGGVIGGVAAILAVALFFFYRRRQRQRNNAHFRKIEIDAPLMGSESPPPEARIEPFPHGEHLDEEAEQPPYPPSRKGPRPAERNSAGPDSSSRPDTAIHDETSEQRLLALRDQVRDALVRVRYGDGSNNVPLAGDVPPPYESSS